MDRWLDNDGIRCDEHAVGPPKDVDGDAVYTGMAIGNQLLVRIHEAPLPDRGVPEVPAPDLTIEHCDQLDLLPPAHAVIRHLQTTLCRLRDVDRVPRCLTTVL